MGNVYREYVSPALTATTAQVIIGPIPIGHLEKVSIIQQNHNATVTITSAVISVAMDASGTGTPSNWQNLNTAAYPYAETVATAAIAAMGSAAYFENLFQWMRITLNASQTMIAGSYRIQVGGRTRGPGIGRKGSFTKGDF